MQATGDLNSLLVEARACRACAGVLPLGPRPILQAHHDANGWLAKNPWFERDVLPAVRQHIAGALD